MAWYDDPNFVNSSPLAPLPTVGITPALPAAPRALNPEPAKPVSDPFADLDAAMTRLAYPEEMDTTPSGLAGIPENTAPVVTLEGLNQRIANKPEAPWVFGGDTLSAAKDYISNIPTFAKGAFYRLSEDNTRPDQYSPGAKAAFEEEARAQQQIEEERLRRERAGESTQLGSAIREAIPSSGFSLGSMGAAAAAGIPAAGLGTLAAGPVGGIVGGISGSMAGSGAAAYRMQRSTFLEDSFKAAEDKSLKENGRSLNEPEKQQLYNELLPLANDSALWEAGPEAIGNAATLVGGGIALKLLGKGALSQIAGGAMKKAAIRAGAATAGVATELGTETATQKGQALADARRDAVLEGKPIDEAVSRYDMPGGGGTLQAFKDIAAPTLGTLVMFGLAGGAVKGGTKAYERIVTNPREAEEIVKLSNDPNIVAALPDSSLKNLSRMSEWLGNQWFQGPERKQLLDNALIKLNAEIANRESESGEIKAERKKTLQSLWDTMGPQEQLGVLGFLQNESVPMTGWVDKEGNALTDKQGRALGEIDVRGLAKLAPVLGLSNDVLQKNFEKVRGDWYARQEANQQQQPSLLVDDYGREIDPKLVGATVPITSTSPSKQQQKQQTPLANLADAVPPTSLVPLPIETLTEKQKKDHVKNIAKISSTKATPEERASAESFLNQFSVVGSRPMDIAFGAKQKSTGVDSTAAPPIAPIEPNIADPNAAGKSMLDEALARQQAEKAKQATQTPPVVEPTDSTPQGAAPNAETTPIGNGPAIQEPGIQVGEIGSQQPGSLGGFDRAGEVGQGQVSEVSSQGPEVVNKIPPAPTVNVGGNTVPTVTSGSQAIIQAISDEAAKGTGNSSTSQLSNPSLPSVPSSVSAPETPVVSPNTNVELPTVQPVVAPVSQNSSNIPSSEAGILPEQAGSNQQPEPAQMPPVPVTPIPPVPVTHVPPSPVTPTPPKTVTPIPPQPKKESSDVVRNQEGRQAETTSLLDGKAPVTDPETQWNDSTSEQRKERLLAVGSFQGGYLKQLTESEFSKLPEGLKPKLEKHLKSIVNQKSTTAVKEEGNAAIQGPNQDDNQPKHQGTGERLGTGSENREQPTEEQGSGGQTGRSNQPEQSGEKQAVTPEKKKQTVVTPNGNKIDTEFEVVELDDLITSDRPEFPSELQPRNRSRVASEIQVDKIANRLDPEQLAESRLASDGAPIVGHDQVVESGNGRVMAVRRVYSQSRLADKAAEYRKMIESRGFDTDGMKNPVLVRRRTTNLSTDERKAFTVDANTQNIAGLSPTERAMIHAGRLTTAILDLYQGGDLFAVKNADFVRAFLDRVALNESSEMTTKDGHLNKEGVNRINNAIIARAYSNVDLMDSWLESQDDNTKSLYGALLDVAAGMVKLKAKIESNLAPSELDITYDVVSAVQIIAKAKREEKSLKDLISNESMFGEPISPMTGRIVKLLFTDESLRRQISREKIANLFNTYLGYANEVKMSDPLFADVPSVTVNDIVKSLEDKKREGNKPVSTGSLFSGNAPSTSGTANREKAQRSVDVAPGKESGTTELGESKGNGEQQQSEGQKPEVEPVEPTEAEKQEESAAQPKSITEVRDELVAYFKDGNGFKTIIQARNFIGDKLGTKIQPGTVRAKWADELVEQAIVKTAESIAKTVKDPVQAYNKLVALYEQQPNLGVRTSTSVENQAYSTPVPLAYLASKLAGISLDDNATVVEPTAGNGALLIEANPSQVLANEINEDRASWLKENGYDVSQKDATEWKPSKKTDILIANPPFGSVYSNGKRKTWTVKSSVSPTGNYQTGEIDHTIVLQQLANMEDDGVAVLLVGGVDAKDNKAKSDKYGAWAKRDFYWTLFNDYNVVDMFTVSGNLYTKQGAGYPVDVIVIHGRGKSALSVPAANIPRVYDSWNSLEGVLTNETLSAEQYRKTVAKASLPGVAGQPSPVGNRPDTGQPGTGNAGDSTAATEPVGNRPDVSKQDIPGERDSRSDARSGVSPAAEQPRETPATNQTGTRPVAPDVAGGVATGKSTVENADLNALFDEILAEETGSVQKQRTTKEAAKSAASNVAMGLGDIMDGLNALFGTKGKLGSGLAFDEETYAKAKPFFQAAIAHFEGAAGDVKETMRLLIRALLNQFKDTGMVKNMQPYVVRFIEDMQKPQTPETKTTAEPTEIASDGQVPYSPASKQKMIGSLVPVNMLESVKSALSALEDRVGSIDEYAASELGYSVDELGKYFSAEQIDALALAISNINNSKGFVIGDGTGTGKGRVNAGIIRWAIKNGKTPIFVTEKPNLYRDMIRDLRDIGMATGATNEEQIQSIVNLIQMTNSGEIIPMDDAAMEWHDKAEAAKENNEKPPKPYGEFLKTPSAAKQAAVLNEITQSSNLPDDKKIVFTTYSQMQPVAGEPTARTHALQSLIGNSVLILDESHNAGGTPQITNNKSFNRAEFVRDLVEKASGVFYSSATFAKRPDVMDLYSRTDMSLAVSNIKELGYTIASGGIPLQQVVSSMLVESGQYLRRERSFYGVEYNTVSTETDKQVAENIATSMRNILEFSKHVAIDVIAISEQIKAQAMSIGATAGVDMGGAESTNFTSVMHNLISQFLLGLKAQATVDKALEAIKTGEKPVITVANTMESLINEYADNNNIGIGEPIDLTFGDLLERYLEKSRMVRETKPFSNIKEPARRLEDSELSPITLNIYNHALAEIRRQDWSKIPVSPLDYIKGELQKAGYKVGEITGRQGVIDYTGDAPIYRMRGENERGIPGRIKAIQQFNNGEIDVLLLNRAGSTGLSLHASPSVGKDLRRRHMIIAQAEGNIDTHMQMLGRVHRTGQVIAPKYSQLVGNIPAEIRPAAVLAKKMASLSANTTSARSNSVSAKDTFDFMNVYGDEAVANLMFSNQDVHTRLGDPLSLSKSGDGFLSEDAARKVTGRLPILPIEQQEQLYRDIEAEYRSILETAIALGENKLEAMTLETDAKEVSSTPVFSGITGESSPFASSASAVVYDIKRQGRSMTQDEIRQELAYFAGVPELKTGGPLKKKIDELSNTVRNEVRDFINREAANLSENELNSLETRTGAMRDKINQVLKSIPPGTSVSAVTPTGSVFYGIVVGIERKGKPKNPAVNNAWQVKIAVADAMRVLTLPLTRFEVGSPAVADRTGRVAIEPADYVEVQEAFERQSGMSRENRVILEGNLLAAYSQFSSGQIVYFRLNSGELKQGILMPRSFDLATALAKQAQIIRSSQEAANFLADESSKKYLIAQGGDVKIQFYPRHKNFPNHFIMTVPASKAQGGRWFLNDRIRAITDDFVKTGNKYMTAIRPVDLPSVLNIIYTDIGEQMKGVDESLISASSNNQSGNQYSIGDNQEAKAPLTVEQARAEVATLIGENQLAAMEKLGKITFHAVNPTNQPNAQAFVDEKGNIHFVVENIQGNFAGIALHEDLHLLKDKGISESQRKIIRLSHAVLALSGLKNFVGNASYDELVKQAHRMAEEGNPHAVKALAKAKEVSPNSPDSEFVNYLVEYAPAHIPFVRRVMSKIRAVLYRMGIKVELRPEDLRELALSAFKQRANQAAKAQEEQAKRIKKIDKQAARFEEKYGPAALQDKRVEVLRSLEDDTTQEEYSKKVLDALKFSIAPSELPIETAKILGEDSSWNLNPDLQGRVVAALRNPLQAIKVGVEKSRPVWLGLLDRQMLVEMIENLPGVGPIAIQFQKTARKLDAMKQELKQKMYPVAEALAEQIARSRDKGYKFSRLLYGSTLHQVDPLGLPPDPDFVGASYDEKQRFAEKEKWYKIVKGWADELERENPALFKLYKEMRANYDYMLNERFNALMARLGRSSEDVATSLLDHAKSKAEKNIDPMVQQLSQLQRDNDKTYRSLKTSLMAVMPQLYPPKKVTIHNYLNPPKAPAPQPVSVIRSKLDASARPLFDAMMERLENATTDGDLQRKIFFGLMAKAEYLTREQGKPGSLSLSGKLASLYKANPKEFDALQTALSAYLSKPNSVIKYEMVPSKRNPNVTIRTISVVDLQNDPLSVEARANLSEKAQKLFVEAARNSQDQIKESAGAIKYFYETAMAQGPYANLMRYGKYEIYAEKEGEKLPIFAKFEDPRDQKRAALALQAEGWTVNSGYQIENRVFEQAPTGSFVGNLIGLVDDVVKNEQEKATLKDDINQLYLASLPDMSASKHFMHRKGIPGFSQDALRGYAQFMNQSANAIARLNFSDIMIRNLRDMKKANDALGVPYDEESSKMQAMAGSVINELNDSYEWQMNPTNSTLANRITGLGFFWYLTNFSTALINMSQVPLMTFPDLAARYGAKNATSEIMKAVKEYGKWKFNWGEGKKKAEEAIDARFDGDMGRMLQFLEKTGAKSRTETVSLAGMGEEDAYFSSNPVVMWANKFAKALSFPFQQSEIANREISAIAAYTLARQAAKDKTPEDAHQYAQEIAYNTVFRTQNDFSNANRARYWRSDLARILLLFKSYAKLMTWRQLRDAHQAFKEIPSNLTGEDKARFEKEKQIAKHRLAYMGAASLVFGGAMGFPLYTIFITIANAFFGNDPDDPYDVETEVNQALQSMAMSLTNNEQSADLIRQTVMKGPVGALMGSDLSPRLSLDLARLWFRKIPEQKTGEQWGLAALQQAAGPVFGGMFIGTAKGAYDIKQGIIQGNTSDVSRGVEGILPAPARNAIKTWRYLTQGVETRRGDKIVDDLSAYEAVMQAIGFAPARVADQYDRNAAMMEVKGWLDTRRKNLINGYVYAVENQDYKKANEFMKDITEFNVKNPSLWIKQDSLIKAMKNRERVRANSNGGLYIPSKGMRTRLEEEQY